MTSIRRVFPKAAALTALALALQLSHAADRKIVILQALTGGAAFVGVPASEGMKFAAEEMNARNFLGSGDKIVVEVADSASARPQAMAAVTRASGNSPSSLVLRVA